MEIVYLVNPLDCDDDSAARDEERGPFTAEQLEAFVQGFPIDAA
jgi:hypothetical protein